MLVLPGGMPGTIHLKEHKGLEKLILKHNEEKKYLAAICAAPTVFGGMGILKGKILRIPENGDLKIPHMGWNSLHLQNNGRLFEGIPEQTYVYFVHSYYLQAEDPEIIKATTEYSTCIHASVEKDNVFACQFHPEKSSKWGLKILKNFAAIGKTTETDEKEGR